MDLVSVFLRLILKSESYFFLVVYFKVNLHMSNYNTPLPNVIFLFRMPNMQLISTQVTQIVLNYHLF